MSRDNEENSLRRANRVNLITGSLPSPPLLLVGSSIMIRTEVYESGRKGGKARRSFRVKEFEPSREPPAGYVETACLHLHLHRLV